MLRSITVLVVVLLLAACGQNEQPEKVRIAINPWPGYELLYLAEQKGFFQQVGANIELVQVSTLSDAQRAYLSGYVDGFTSTMIEAIQVDALGGEPIKIVLLADYSDGGDVIIAPDSVADIKSLAGKTVGCEVSSLGIFVLERALHLHQMQLDDVKIINVEQGAGKGALAVGKISAMVTYPPYSVEMLSSGDYAQIFSTREIPQEVLDTLSISAHVLQENPLLASQIRQAWQMAMNYLAKHPQDAISIMAKREGLSVQEFETALADLKLLSIDEQSAMFQRPEQMHALGQSVCQTLVKIDAITSDCSHVNQLFYYGF